MGREWSENVYPAFFASFNNKIEKQNTNMEIFFGD
jgi:hypothetical protein